LKASDDVLNVKKYLFELPGGASCYITRTATAGPWLRCTPGVEKDFSIDLAELPDIQSWMHLTYSANYSSATKSESYLRIDISSFSKVVRGAYASITDQYAYYGMSKVDKSKLYSPGFVGDYRQFYITLGYIEPANVPNLMHQYKVLDYSTMGYYKFENTILLDRYDDAFRSQRANVAVVPPVFRTENIAAPFCNSIPQSYY